jgi:hypothetical protein
MSPQRLFDDALRAAPPGLRLGDLAAFFAAAPAPSAVFTTACFGAVAFPAGTFFVTEAGTAAFRSAALRLSPKRPEIAFFNLPTIPVFVEVTKLCSPA